MDETRETKEEILKAKLGSEEIDLTKVSDEELDKAMTDEAKDEFVKKVSEDKLDISDLDSEEKDKVVDALTKDKDLASIFGEKKSKEDTVKELCECGFNSDEAEDVYSRESVLKESTSIDKLYEMLHCEGFAIPETDPRDAGVEYHKPIEVKVPDETPIESLEDQKGEKLGDAPDIPEMEYEYEKEAKKMYEASTLKQKFVAPKSHTSYRPSVEIFETSTGETWISYRDFFGKPHNCTKKEADKIIKDLEMVEV